MAEIERFSLDRQISGCVEPSQAEVAGTDTRIRAIVDLSAGPTEWVAIVPAWELPNAR